MVLQVEPKHALLRAIGKAMADRASECNPQEISNCVWAFARLSRPHLHSIHTISSSHSSVAAHCMSSCSWLNQLCCNHRLSNPTHRIRRLQQAVIAGRSMAGCDAQRSVRDFAAGFYDEGVMDVLANEAQRRIEEFSQQNLVSASCVSGVKPTQPVV